jgi:hypothetical protein
MIHTYLKLKSRGFLSKFPRSVEVADNDEDTAGISKTHSAYARAHSDSIGDIKPDLPVRDHCTPAY